MNEAGDDWRRDTKYLGIDREENWKTDEGWKCLLSLKQHISPENSEYSNLTHLNITFTRFVYLSTPLIILFSILAVDQSIQNDIYLFITPKSSHTSIPADPSRLTTNIPSDNTMFPLTRVFAVFFIGFFLLHTTYAQELSKCILTNDQLDQLNSRETLSAVFLILSFPQTAGATVETIATNLSADIISTFTGSINVRLDQICIFSATLDSTTFSPVIEVVILPDYTTGASDTPLSIKTNIWSALNIPSNPILSSSTYLKYVDLTRSQSPNSVIQLYVCKNDKAFVEVNASCTDIDPTPDKKKFDQSLNSLSIILFFVSLVVTAISAIIFWLTFNKYELRADYKNKLKIQQSQKLAQKLREQQ